MKRILFVDDENNILDGIRRMLHADRKRWEMEFAVGGEAALRTCEAAAFDVVVSDMRMPQMDGATLLTHLQSRYPATTRILLSGQSDAESIARAIPVAHRFLAKPCNASELQHTIERVCTLQDLLSAGNLRRIVGSIGELPSHSSAHASLMQAVNDPKTCISHVAQILERDMAMSAKVLQLVNSAFFGMAQTVTSLNSAASYLGIETIKNLALASETFRIFVPDPRIPSSICESLQSHAQSTASIAAKLTEDVKTRPIAVVSALLHDIGSLVLASKMPDEFCASLALASERKCEDFEAEEEILGTSHAEVGAYLLGLWGLPTLAVEAIAHHHHPARIPHSGMDSSAVLYVADLLAQELEQNPSESSEVPLAECHRDCLETLGVMPRLAEFRALARQQNSR